MASTVIVNIIGNVRGLERALGQAQNSLRTLSGGTNGINRALKGLAITGVAAGAAMGGAFAAAGVAAGSAFAIVAVGAASLAAVPALFAKMGLAALKGTKAGKDAIKDLKSETAALFQEASKPFQNSMLDTFSSLQAIIKTLRPELNTIYTGLSKSLDGVNTRLQGVAETIGPDLVMMFKAGLPVFEAVLDGLFNIADGFIEMIRTMAPASQGFATFVSTLMSGIAGILPEIGSMAVAFLPLATTIAGKILPAFRSIGNFMTGELLPLVKQLGPASGKAFGVMADAFRGIGRGLPALIKGINGFFAAFKTGPGSGVETFFKTLMTSMGALLPMFGQLLAALAPVATQLLQVLTPAFQQFGGLLLSVVIPVLTTLLTFLNEHQGVANALVIAYLAMSAGMAALTIATKLATAVQLALNAGLLIYRGLAIAVQGVTAAWTGVQWLLNAALAANPIGLVIIAIVALVAAIVIAWKNSETFRTIVIRAWNAIKAAASSVWGFIKNLLANVWGWIKSAGTAYFNGYKAVITRVWSAIRSATSSAWNFIRNYIRTVITVVRSVITGALGTIRNVWSTTWNTAQRLIRTVWNGIRSGVRDGISRVMELVRGLKDRVKGALSNAGSWLISAGRDVMRGFIDGVRQMAGNVVSAVTGPINSAIGKAKGLLGINSPSRVFREIGEYVNDGLVLGLKNIGGVRTAASGLAAAVQNGFINNAPELAMGGNLAGAGGGMGSTVQITVNVPPTANPAEVGREVKKSLDAYYAIGGRK